MKKLLLLLMVLLTGCQQNIDNSKVNNPPSKPAVLADVLLPKASGESVYKSELVDIDYSNVDQGYILVKTNSENHQKLKVQIIKDDEKYNYDLAVDNQYITYPLNMGDGIYTIKVYESLDDTRFVPIASLEVEVELARPYINFLYPSQIVDYNIDTESVKLSIELNQNTTTELERVANVYEYVTDNIGYDWRKADDVNGKYILPVVDDTLKTQKGICFDYAALMSVMLRVQNIPTKIVTGYVDEGYHAWVEVYLDNIGWITPHIYFEKQQWQLLDPTFEAMGSQYDGSYQKKYEY